MVQTGFTMRDIAIARRELINISGFAKERGWGWDGKEDSAGGFEGTASEYGV